MAKERRLKSPKGLIEQTTRSVNFGEEGFELEPKGQPGEFVMRAPHPKATVDDMLQNMVEIAEEALQNAGHDPADWFSIKRAATVADEAFFGAQMLRDVSRLHKGLAGLNDGRVWELVRQALVTGYHRHALEVVMHEEGVLRDLARQGGTKKGGKAPKRKRWADVLADCLRRDGHDKASAMRVLEDDGVEEDAPELEYRFYIQGDNVYCDDANKTDGSVGNMTVRNFFERYFRSN